MLEYGDSRVIRLHLSIGTLRLWLGQVLKIALVGYSALGAALVLVGFVEGLPLSFSHNIIIIYNSRH